MLLLPHYAGNRHSIPHFYIPGRTPRPARRFADDQTHRSCMVAVCIQLGHPNLVVRLPTPEEKYTRAKKKQGSVWVNLKPTATSPLTSDNYCRLVLTPLARSAGKAGPGPRRSPRNPVRLVHDKDSVHTSKETAAFAVRHNIQLIELPPRSPDLDPLDYGVFGAVKTAWRSQVEDQQLGWDESCSLFIQLLREANAEAAIKGLHSRIQKCITAKGQRFEH